MSTQTAEIGSNGLGVAVRMIAKDASDRLIEAVRLPTRDDAVEDKLRALITALYAAYPQVLETVTPS